jgi:tetratricopeptide (TPR) repeat protein
MQQEDAEAEPLVAELLAGGREEWMPRLMGDEKYRTGGVVRRLIAATDRAIEEAPKDYVEIAKITVEIADLLETGMFERSEIAALRGAAYRERSYSAYLSGEIDLAFSLAQRAESILTTDCVPPYDRGRVAMLLATIEWRRDHLPEAEQYCSDAETFFIASSDKPKVVHASIVRAAVKAKRHDYRGALALTSLIIRDFGDLIDHRLRAALSCNEGVYLRELGDLPAAIRSFQDARFVLETLGARASATRVAFNEAVLLQRVGDQINASERLESVMRGFDELGMRSAAAQAALHLAESRLIQERFADVNSLCAYVVEQVSSSPDAYREHALTALALIRDAAARRHASEPVLHRIRRHIDSVPMRQPELMIELAFA